MSDRGRVGVGLGVCSRYIVTTGILPMDLERVSRYKGVTETERGGTFFLKIEN